METVATADSMSKVMYLVRPYGHWSANVACHRLDTGDSLPINLPPYRTSPGTPKEIQCQVNPIQGLNEKLSLL